MKKGEPKDGLSYYAELHVLIMHNLEKVETPIFYAFHQSNKQTEDNNYGFYRERVKNALSRHGYFEAEPGAKPDLFVSFLYEDRQFWLSIIYPPPKNDLSKGHQVGLGAFVQCHVYIDNGLLLVPKMVEAIFRRFPGGHIQHRIEATSITTNKN